MLKVVGGADVDLPGLNISSSATAQIFGQTIAKVQAGATLDGVQATTGSGVS